MTAKHCSYQSCPLSGLCTLSFIPVIVYGYEPQRCALAQPTTALGPPAARGMRSEFRGLAAATEPPAPSDRGTLQGRLPVAPSMYAYVFELSCPGAGGGNDLDGFRDIGLPTMRRCRVTGTIFAPQCKEGMPSSSASGRIPCADPRRPRSHDPIV